MNLLKLQEIVMDMGACWAKSMVSQTVGHNLVTEQLLTEVYKNLSNILHLFSCQSWIYISNINSGKNTGVGNPFFPQEIFLTQGSNLGLLTCRQILYLEPPGKSLINL